MRWCGNELIHFKMNDHMIEDVTTKAKMVQEGTRRASISSDLKPWPDWFTTLYLFFCTFDAFYTTQWYQTDAYRIYTQSES